MKNIFEKVVPAEQCPHFIPLRYVATHGAGRCVWCVVKVRLARRKR